MSRTETDVLVVGGGPAGITFARTLRKLEPGLRITMLRPEEHSMVYCAIPYAIQGLFGPEKTYKSDKLVTDVGIELVRKRALSIDIEGHEASVEDGTTIAYRTLFLATGARPARPPVPGAHARNVFTVKTRDDMLGIVRRIEEGARRAVVVGAGAIGVEQAQAYQERGLEVYLIERETRVLPSLLDEDMAIPVAERLGGAGVNLRLGRAVESLPESDGLAHAVVLDDGERIELDPDRDFVCFAIGMRPELELVEGQGLATGPDGLLVDSTMRTSHPDVYAAGDGCQFHSGIDGERIGGKLATNAVPMAKIAARNVAGIEDHFEGFYNGAATCCYELRAGGTGFTESLARERGLETVSAVARMKSLFPMMPGATDLAVKIVAEAGSGQVLGGQVLAEVSTTDKVDVISLAVQLRLTVSDLARLSYSAQPWQSFFPARSAIVDACEQIRDRLEARPDRHPGSRSSEPVG